jgi:hypothetical protein
MLLAAAIPTGKPLTSTVIGKMDYTLPQVSMTRLQRVATWCGS